MNNLDVPFFMCTNSVGRIMNN
uniref:Uncharacterized protein n=1 Tax=Anguilla anguilla TaxID=7936 RepID=A0A0E9T7V6_ANGAN